MCRKILRCGVQHGYVEMCGAAAYVAMQSAAEARQVQQSQGKMRCKVGYVEMCYKLTWGRSVQQGYVEMRCAAHNMLRCVATGGLCQDVLRSKAVSRCAVQQSRVEMCCQAKQC